MALAVEPLWLWVMAKYSDYSDGDYSGDSGRHRRLHLHMLDMYRLASLRDRQEAQFPSRHSQQWQIGYQAVHLVSPRIASMEMANKGSFVIAVAVAGARLGQTQGAG